MGVVDILTLTLRFEGMSSVMGNQHVDGCNVQWWEQGTSRHGVRDEEGMGNKHVRITGTWLGYNNKHDVMTLMMGWGWE